MKIRTAIGILIIAMLSIIWWQSPSSETALEQKPEPVPETAEDPPVSSPVISPKPGHADRHEDNRPVRDTRWPTARVIEQAVFPTSSPDIDRQVTLLQPPNLPYPVRVEEFLNRQSTKVLEREEMVANRLIVRLAEGASPEAFNAAFADNGIRIERRLSSIGLVEVSVPLGLDGVPDALSAIQGRPDLVRYAESDGIVHAMREPNDPRFADGTLWGLNNANVTNADIDAPEGWNIRTNAPGIIVGVIDSGIRATHEDLAGNMWRNPGESGLDAFGADRSRNGLDDDGNGIVDDVHGLNAITAETLKRGDPTDDNGHGSHTAGTIGAVGNNGLGVAGVAWEVELMALKFISSGGSGATSDAIECMEYALSQGVHVLSNSWGGGRFNQALLDMIRLLRDNGVVFVAAAGNASSSNDVERIYPAAYAVDNIVAVAAIDRNGKLAEYSNFGYGTVQVAAPGTSILSIGDESDSAYMTMSGTSMAGPHVAGILALLAAEFPGEDYAALINRLLSTTTRLPDLTGRVMTGGLANLEQALNAGDIRPFNDFFSNASPLTGSEVYLRASNRHASEEAGEPVNGEIQSGSSVWWSWRAPVDGMTIINLEGSDFDTVLGVYTSGDLPDLTLVASNDDHLGLPASRVQFMAEEGREYHIRVSGKGDEEGLIVMNLAGPPENDFLERATELPALPAFLGSNALNGTAEPGEPSHAGLPASRSLWWKWTADSTGTVAFSSEFSTFDAVLAVYSGGAPIPAMEDLLLVAENDDNLFSGTWAEVKIDAVPGETYFIALDHKAGEGTQAWLRAVFTDVNDDFSRRFILPGDRFSVSGFNTRSTVEPGEPDHDGNGSGKSVWWEWIPETSGDFLITTDGSRLSTVIGVYRGTGVTELETIASDTNSGPGGASQVVVKAIAGQPMQIAVDKQRDSEFFGEIQLAIRPIVLPPNDDFPEAADITNFPATLTGFNTGATSEPGEPLPGEFNHINTVWWRWIPSEAGDVTVSTNGSDFDTVLGVYQGTTLQRLQRIAFDDDSGIGRNSFIRFTALAGATYHFQVSGYNNATGNVVLNVEPFKRPANDDLVSAEIITGNFHHRQPVNIGAGREPGEAVHAPLIDGIDPDPGGATIWYRWTPGTEQAGRTVATTYGTGFGTTVAVYEGPEHHPTHGSLQLVSANTHRGETNGWGQIVWNAEAEKWYYIVLEGDYGQTGQFAFSFWTGPPHDSFGDRLVLSGSIIATEGVVNFGATKETGEPNHAGNRGGKSLWWEWTAPQPGLVRISTRGSTFTDQWGSHSLDTLLAVYRGTTLNNLNSVAANDDISRDDRNSEVVFQATAGIPYVIAVDGANPRSDHAFAAAGWVELHIEPFAGPANDDFSDAQQVSGAEIRFIGSLLGATRENREPSHGEKSRRSIWYRWTAPESGLFIAANAGSLYLDQATRRPGIAVYTGQAVASLQRVAQGTNNTLDASGLAIASFEAVAGTTYHLAIDDSDDSNRHVSRLMINQAPPNDDFVDATVITSRAAILTGHNLGATEQPGEPQIESWKDPAADNTSVWWRWTAGATGRCSIDTLGSEIYNIMGVYTGDSLDALNRVTVVTGTARDPINPPTMEERQRSGNARLDFNAVAGTTYHIMVSGSFYDRSSQGQITLALDGPAGTPLMRASDFQGQALDALTVALSWLDPNNSEAGWEIQRSFGSMEFRTVATLPPSGETGSFTDSGLSPGTHYNYRIRAIGYENSDWSEPLAVQTRFVTHATFPDWQTAHFTTEDLANPEISGTGADPDQDGLPNKLEYVLMTNPSHMDPDQPGIPQLGIINLDDRPYPTLTLSWSLDVSDAVLSIEASSDFQVWEPLPLDDPRLHLLIRDEPTISPQRRTLTIRDNQPIHQGRVFRLRAD